MSTTDKVKVDPKQTVAQSKKSFSKKTEMVDVLVESLQNLSEEQSQKIIQKLSHKGSHIGAQVVNLFEAMLLRKLQEKMQSGELDRELSRALGLPEPNLGRKKTDSNKASVIEVSGERVEESKSEEKKEGEVEQAKSLPQLTWFVEQFIGRALSEVIRRAPRSGSLRDREHIRNEELKAELQKRKREQLNESLSQTAKEIRSVVNSWAFILYFFVLVLTLGAFIGLLVGINLPNVTTNLSNQSWLQLLKFKIN